MLKAILIVAATLLVSAVARAETWIGLNNYVKSCDLIVLCRTEVKAGSVKYRVSETWKGEYRPDLFYHKPSTGFLHTGEWHGNESPTDGREIIFFFDGGSQPEWTKGKLLDHSTSFVVTDGKVVYAATDRNLRQEYSVADFKKAILMEVNRGRESAKIVAVGGLAIGLVAPPSPELPKNPLEIPGSRLAADDNNKIGKKIDAIPLEPAGVDTIWWVLGIVLLGAVIFTGYFLRSSRRSRLLPRA